MNIALIVGAFAFVTSVPFCMEICERLTVPARDNGWLLHVLAVAGNDSHDRLAVAPTAIESWLTWCLYIELAKARQTGEWGPFDRVMARLVARLPDAVPDERPAFATAAAAAPAASMLEPAVT